MRDRRARHDARANNRGRSQRPSAEGIRKCALEGSESIFMPSKYRGETSCERLENIGCRWEPEEGCYFLDGYNDNMREYFDARILETNNAKDIIGKRSIWKDCV